MSGNGSVKIENEGLARGNWSPGFGIVGWWIKRRPLGRGCTHRVREQTSPRPIDPSERQGRVGSVERVWRDSRTASAVDSSVFHRVLLLQKSNGFADRILIDQTVCYIFMEYAGNQRLVWETFPLRSTFQLF